MTQDPDAGLTPYERTRRALHRAVDNIARAWSLALEDANARGYPTAVMQPSCGGSESTSVEQAAMRPSRAVAWLAELHDTQQLIFKSRDGLTYTIREPETFRGHAHAYVEHMLTQWMPHTEHAIRQTITLSNKATAWWPPTPKAGQTVDGTTVGQRGNQTETCHSCGNPVSGGHADPIRRIDGFAYHGKSCWYNASRGRSYQPITPRSAA